MAFGNKQVIPTIAVSDIGAAREFYEATLGLSSGDERPDGGVRYPCGGGSELHVYPSPDNAGKSPATLAAFEVDDIEAAVAELTAKGVKFEQYDMDELKTDERGIAELGELKGAWFKDPDGNVLAIAEE